MYNEPNNKKETNTMPEPVPLSPEQVEAENIKNVAESARLERVQQNIDWSEQENSFDTDTPEEAMAAAAAHSKKVMEFVEEHRDTLHEQALAEDKARKDAASAIDKEDTSIYPTNAEVADQYHESEG